ncbi:hypothetical protein [Clostridium tagluense]|uniref:hypothetical protein n=1 Tax=Clostridium tagluense TaxID=360422 RepID=UPI001CF4C6B2|nr:hypothetical protein [Clostridium tagluense]MCB2300832.1 hypothetical protein [Clostridium tagluense]
MKKTLRISIKITVIIMLIGCSSTKKGDNMENPTVSASLSSNQQSQSQSKDTAPKIKATNSNTNSNLLESIDTTKSHFEKGYYDYNGTINNSNSIRMSIYPLGKDMVGTYYYEKYGNEIKLKGKAGEKNIILYEYDETGKNTGIFKGTMSDIVGKIEGTWISADNKISYPFVLKLESIIGSAEYGKRYAQVVNNKSDQDVENFVSKIQNYIANDNKAKLAEEIKYPINVKINGKAIKIQNKDELIKNYDKIFYADYKQKISKAPTKYLFVNYQGIMVGSGLIWINDFISTGSNSKLMVSAINN